MTTKEIQKPLTTVERRVAAAMSKLIAKGNKETGGPEHIGAMAELTALAVADPEHLKALSSLQKDE